MISVGGAKLSTILVGLLVLFIIGWFVFKGGKIGPFVPPEAPLTLGPEPTQTVAPSTNPYA